MTKVTVFVDLDGETAEVVLESGRVDAVAETAREAGRTLVRRAARAADVALTEADQ